MPNISNMRLRELERAEADLKQRIRTDTIGWVGIKLGEALAMNLALKPYAQWTDKEKALLRQVTDTAVTARALYIDQLPKESM